MKDVEKKDKTEKVIVPSKTQRSLVLGKFSKKSKEMQLKCCYTVCSRCK